MQIISLPSGRPKLVPNPDKCDAAKRLPGYWNRQAPQPPMLNKDRSCAVGSKNEYINWKKRASPIKQPATDCDTRAEIQSGDSETDWQANADITSEISEESV